MKRWGIVVAVVAVVALIGVAGAWQLRLLPISVDDCPAGNGPTAIWIGDSYTLGQGVGEASGYSCLVSDKLGWRGVLDAQGSTGFLANGDGRSRWFEPLPDRLSDTAQEWPDPAVVIIDAGRNDIFNFTEAEVREGAERYLRQASEIWPDAQMVVVLPWLAGEPEIHRLADEIRAAAEEVDASVIDTAGWADGVSTLDDGVHPDRKSHELIAERLIRSFGRMGLDAQAEGASESPRR